jgi:hypothetical protein
MVKWSKILVLLVGVALAAVVLAWQVSSARWTEYARTTIEHELSNALEQPVVLRQLSISFVPLKIDAAGFAVGVDGQVIRFEDLSLRILPWSSLKQARPVGDATIGGLLVDVTKLVDESDEEEDDDDEAMFPFRLRDLRLSDARVVIPVGDDPVYLNARSLVGSVGLSPISRRFSLLADGDLTIRHAARELDIQELHLQGAEARDGWVVQRLDLSSDALEMTGRLEGRDPPRHAVSAKLQLQRLGQIDPSLDWLSGDFETIAELTGSLDDPDGTAKVRVVDLAVDGRELGNLDGQLTRTRDVVDLASTHLDGLGGDVKMQGQLAFSPGLPIELTIDWGDLDVARLARLLAEDAPASLLTSGSLSGSGTLEPLDVSSKGSGRLMGGGAAPLEWTFAGRYSDSLRRIEVDASQTNANTIRGSVTVAADESIEGDLAIQLGDVAVLGELVGRDETMPFSGHLTATAAVTGSLSEPTVDGDLAARNFVVFGAPVGSVKGNFLADTRHVRSDGLVADFGDGRIEVSGTIGFDTTVANDWQATIRDVQVDRLAGLVRNVSGVSIPLAGGRVSLRAKGRGPWSEVEATGRLEARSFALADEPFESLTVEVGTSWPDWKLEASMVHAREERLDASMSGRGLEEVVNASVRSNEWSLEHLRLGSTEVRGAIRLEGAVHGRIDSLDGQVQVVASDLAWSDREFGDVSVDAKATNGDWQLTSDLLADTVHLNGVVDSKGGRFRLEANWTEAELAGLFDDRPGIRIATSGTLLLSGGFAEPQSLDGEAQMPLLLIRSGSLQVEAQEPIRISADKGRFTIESFTLAGDQTRVSLNGTFTTGGELDVEAEGTGDLELLELIGKPIESVEGSFELAVSAERRLGQNIELRGTASVADAAVDIGLPIGVTETDGRFALEGARVRIEKLDGHMGGGTFSVDGGVDLERGPDLGWRLVEVSGSLMPSLEQELSGHGTLRGAWDDLTVAGEVEILRMLYDRNIEPRDFIPTFKRRLAPVNGQRSSNVVRLDLDVFAPDDLHIDNNFARVEAMADLRVRGTTEQPKLGGRIDVLTGEVFFRDRTFDVITGVVDFRPQRNLIADLNITAETVVDTADTSYGITVQISGTTDDPRVVLSADDAGLTQTDVLSLITFGKTVAQLQQGGGGSPVDALVGFAANKVAGGVERGAESFLRVDRVDIAPSFSASGNFEPQVKITKDISDNLSASVATTLGANLQRSLDLEYHLTDRTSLFGTWESESEGQAGAFGGGVKFRREFRRVPGLSLLGSTEK